MFKREEKLYVLLSRVNGKYGLLNEPHRYITQKNTALSWLRLVPDLDLAIGEFDEHVHNSNDYKIIEVIKSEPRKD